MRPNDAESNTRNRLVEAAILCFGEKGFDGTGIREIALRAKANSAMVQYHFGGKEGLYNAALKSIFESRPPVMAKPPEDPHAPGARAEAIRAIREVIQSILHELMDAGNATTATPTGTALDRASLLLVTREMQAPRTSAAPVLLEHIRPCTDRFHACLRVLRPELQAPELHEMTISVYSQLFFVHSNLAMIRLMRGDPDYPRDLPALIRHITDFSLRGLGIPEAFQPGG